MLVHRPRTNNVLAMYWVSTSPLAPSVSRLCVSGMIAPFTHFSLFSPFDHSLNHIPLSQPVTSLFILIFHPLLRACTHNIQPARRVSFFSLFSRSEERRVGKECW